MCCSDTRRNTFYACRRVCFTCCAAHRRPLLQAAMRSAEDEADAAAAAKAEQEEEAEMDEFTKVCGL